ncbi:MAG TPA: hypothetical protein GXZ52_01020 [Clostridiales bacterium]|nr:hypothetical protein [Clostridiales bacterium]
MGTILLEINADECTLTAATSTSVSVYLIDPYDFSICCAWIPTAELRIEKRAGGYRCTNLNTGTSARLTEKLGHKKLNEITY